MIVTTTWEWTDIKAGVKLVDKTYHGVTGTIVKMPGPKQDNVVSASTFAVMDSSFEMLTQFMKASELAKLLTEKGCTL